MKKYKFKVGDKVRIKSGVDLGRLCILGEDTIAELMDSELTITDDKPGWDGWSDKELDGTPTYSVGVWRIPEGFLKRA